MYRDQGGPTGGPRAALGPRGPPLSPANYLRSALHSVVYYGYFVVVTSRLSLRGEVGDLIPASSAAFVSECNGDRCLCVPKTACRGARRPKFFGRTE